MTLPTTRIDTLSSSATPVTTDDPQDILLVDFVPNGTSSIVSHRTVTPTSPEGALSRFPTAYSSSSSIPTYNNHRPEYHHRYTNSHSIPPPTTTQDISNFTLVNLSSNIPNELEDQEDQEVSQFMGNHGSSVPLQPLQRNSFFGQGGSVTSHSLQQKVSSSLSSSASDDSDTGFLVPQNNGEARNSGKAVNKHYQNHNRIRRSNHVEDTIPSYPGSPGGPPHHRKKLRRRRPSGGRRKSNQPHSMDNHDALAACCCLGDEDQPHQRTSLTSKYLRCSCLIVMIIAVTTFASIVVSLQRKVDSLSWEVKKLSAAGSSPLPSGTNDQDNLKQNPSVLQEVKLSQDQLNASLSSLKSLVDEISVKVSRLEKQPSIEQVRQEEARLGTDLRGYIDELKKEFENFKISQEKNAAALTSGDESKVPSATDPSKGPT